MPELPHKVMFYIIYCQMPLFPTDVFQETMRDILEHGCPYV